MDEIFLAGFEFQHLEGVVPVLFEDGADDLSRFRGEGGGFLCGVEFAVFEEDVRRGCGGIRRGELLETGALPHAPEEVLHFLPDVIGVVLRRRQGEGDVFQLPRGLDLVVRDALVVVGAEVVVGDGDGGIGHQDVRVEGDELRPVADVVVHEFLGDLSLRHGDAGEDDALEFFAEPLLPDGPFEVDHDRLVPRVADRRVVGLPVEGPRGIGELRAEKRRRGVAADRVDDLLVADAQAQPLDLGVVELLGDEAGPDLVADHPDLELLGVDPGLGPLVVDVLLDDVGEITVGDPLPVDVADHLGVDAAV